MIEDRLRQAATVFENTSEGIIVTVNIRPAIFSGLVIL
jgi:hypothetical protein